MTTAKLDSFFRSILDLKDFESADSSMNGIQVDNDGGEVKKLCFAVDASMETFRRAAAAGAGMIFVHHGLFWGKPLALKGVHRERIKFLLDNNMALYAVHLPLDQNQTLGNNAALAELLGIENPEPFGSYHGKCIGYKGRLAKPLSIDEAVVRVTFMGRPPLGVYPFGKAESETCAVISGGGGDLSFEALESGVDLYVTGEAGHTVYNYALEGRLNLIAGGHYSTEVWGVRRVMEAAAQITIDAEFIDAPTGL